MEKIRLPLTAAERKLLCDDPQIAAEFADRLSKTDGDVPFTLDELNDLVDLLSAVVNHCKNRKKQKVLDNICDKIEQAIHAYGPPLRIAKRSPDDDDEPIEINIPDFGFQPFKLEDGAAEYFSLMADQILQAGRAAGLTIDEIIADFEPVRIEPITKLELRLTVAERALLLELLVLSETIKGQIRLAPRKCRSIGFTLSQINEIENAVAEAVQAAGHPKFEAKCKPLEGKLFDIQTHFVTDDVPQDSMRRMLLDEPRSRGAFAREMLIRRLQAQRIEPEGR